MINEFEVSKGLLDHLRAIPGLPEIATEGAEYDPKEGKSYLREFDLSGSNESPTLSSDLEHKTGLYQIDVVTPANGGKWSALTIADTIKQGFSKSSFINYGGTRIFVVKKDRSGARREGAWYVVSVTITYSVVKG